MSVKKFWYLFALLAFVALPLAGCGGGGTSAVTKEGYKVTVGGTVEGGKSSLKSLFAAAPDLGTVTIINAQDGATLATGAVDSTGKFSNISVSLPSAKAVLVFKAEVTLAGSPFRTIVPIDLSTPPPAGITASNAVNIAISQDTTNVAKAVSAMLGLTGVLGDTGATMASVSKTFTNVADEVLRNGGQVLAYNTTGLSLTGQVASASLLPAQDSSTLTYDDLLNVQLDGKVLSAFVPGSKAIVNFQVVNKKTGKGISGIKNFGLHIAQLKPETDGSNSVWLNYILQTTTSRDRKDLPAADSGYSIIDHGDGSYTVTFGADLVNNNAYVLSKRDTDNDSINTKLVYDATLIHRIGITVSQPFATGTGPTNPATGATVDSFTPPNVAALTYDFIPSTGAQYVNPNGGNYARDIVVIGACDQCHGTLVNHGHHFGSRPDTKICVICHTQQNKRQGQPSADFTPFIHKLHMGEELPTKEVIAGIDVNEIRYPQDIRNCTKCHQGKDVNNWKTKPSRKACGSCHSKVDFAAHEGGQTSDKYCAGCHAGTSAVKEVSVVHRTNVSTPNNPDLPAGVSKFEYEIGSVTLNASRNPVITFKIKKDGVAVSAFAAPPTLAASTSTNSKGQMLVPSSYQPISNFTGGPTFYFAYAVSQDGIAAPADFNATVSASLNNLLVASGSPKAGTLSGPDSNGFFTATITGDLVGQALASPNVALNASPVYIPATAKMLTASMFGSFTQVDKNVPIYVQQVTKTATGYTARRAIVSNAKCNACHEMLGTKPNFHVGVRNDATMCAMCHNPNRTSSGWSANASSFIHGLHAASFRTKPYIWHKTADSSGNVTWTAEKITYPGVLRNCEQCHIAGTYDFTATDSLSAFDNLLFSTVATSGSYATNLSTEFKKADGTSYSPKQYMTTIGQVSPVNFNTADLTRSYDVVNGTFYGPGFAVVLANPVVYDQTGLVSAAVTEQVLQAASTSLVSSPVSAACYSCHDTAKAKAHMLTNGGSLYEARSTALGKKEACLVCHGPRGADTTLPVSGAVPTIKAVHRWW